MYASVMGRNFVVGCFGTLALALGLACLWEPVSQPLFTKFSLNMTDQRPRAAPIRVAGRAEDSASSLVAASGFLAPEKPWSTILNETSALSRQICTTSLRLSLGSLTLNPLSGSSVGLGKRSIGQGVEMLLATRRLGRSH